MRGLMLELAATRNWSWDVYLELNPDALLASYSGITVISDSFVLDRCAQWFNAARQIIDANIPNAHRVELGGPHGSGETNDSGPNHLTRSPRRREELLTLRVLRGLRV